MVRAFLEGGSEEVLPAAREPLGNAGTEPAAPPGIERDLVGGVDIEREEALHLARERLAEHDDVGLVVMDEAPPVEIRRPDARPDAVDDRRLGVQQRVAPLEDTYAGGEQLVVVRPAGI